MNIILKDALQVAASAQITFEREQIRGWVLYDGDCTMCTDLALFFKNQLEHRGFVLAPLQTDWVRKCLCLPEEQLLSEMRVLTPNGSLIGGADAIVHLCRFIWWAWPYYAVAQLPGIRQTFRMGYRWIARHRRCIGGSCR